MLRTAQKPQKHQPGAEQPGKGTCNHFYLSKTPSAGFHATGSLACSYCHLRHRHTNCMRSQEMKPNYNQSITVETLQRDLVGDWVSERQVRFPCDHICRSEINHGQKSIGPSNPAQVRHSESKTYRRALCERVDTHFLFIFVWPFSHRPEVSPDKKKLEICATLCDNFDFYLREILPSCHCVNLNLMMISLTCECDFRRRRMTSTYSRTATLNGRCCETHMSVWPLYGFHGNRTRNKNIENYVCGMFATSVDGTQIQLLLRTISQFFVCFHNFQTVSSVWTVEMKGQRPSGIETSHGERVAYQHCFLIVALR